jgi:hypothetical protein
MVNKEKQTDIWYINVDLEIHYMCGQFIQNSDDDDYYVTCPNCGQKWYVTARALPVKE